MPGPLIVLRTSHPLPDMLLLELEHPILPPLPKALLDEVREDEHINVLSYKRLFDEKVPAERFTKLVPRRRFDKGRDSITRLEGWVETRIWWVDVPT